MANLMTRSRQHRKDIVRYGQNYLIEMDGIELYRALAAAEKDEKRAAIFRKILRAEERHAQRWARLIQTGGGVVPTYRRSLRVRLLGWLARHFGTERVVPIISASKRAMNRDTSIKAEAEGLPAEERAHSRVLREMDGRAGRGWRYRRTRGLAYGIARRQFARGGVRHQ